MFMTNFETPTPQPTELTGGFVPEARPDPLNPPVTDAEVAQTKSVNAPGHIARPGDADAMDTHFQERQNQPFIPTERVEH